MFSFKMTYQIYLPQYFIGGNNERTNLDYLFRKQKSTNISYRKSTKPQFKSSYQPRGP